MRIVTDKHGVAYLVTEKQEVNRQEVIDRIEHLEKELAEANLLLAEYDAATQPTGEASCPEVEQPVVATEPAPEAPQVEAPAPEQPAPQPEPVAEPSPAPEAVTPPVAEAPIEAAPAPVQTEAVPQPSEIVVQ